MNKENILYENKFQNFSNKMRWLNLFFCITIAMMHTERIYVTLWGEEDSSLIPSIMNHSSYCAMYFFFFASAFWFFNDYDNRKYFTKIKSRIKSILIPYLFWNLAKIIAVQLLSIITDRNLKYSFKEVLINFCFIEIGNYSLQPLNGPLWYLIRIMTYFIFAPLFYWVFKRKVIGFIALAFIAVSTTHAGYYTWFRWLFVFSLGTYIVLNYKEAFIALLNVNIINFKYGGILFVAFYAILTCIDRKIGTFSFLPFSDAPLRCLLIVFIGIIFINIRDISQKHSSFAFVLYCSHVIWVFPLLKIIRAVFDKFSLNYQGIQQILAFIILFVFTIIFNYLFKTLLPKLYQMAIGGRY